MQRTIWIHPVSESPLTIAGLNLLCEPYGQIVSINIAANSAFVRFRNRYDAIDAARGLHNTIPRDVPSFDYPIKCRMARSEPFLTRDHIRRQLLRNLLLQEQRQRQRDEDMFLLRLVDSSRRRSRVHIGWDNKLVMRVR